MSRIVTLTLNPCIDLNMEVEEIVMDTPLRSIAQNKRAGGKGINVSEALSVLGVSSVALAPLGGHSGREFADLAESRLDPELVRLVPIKIGQPTRTNTVITSTKDGKHIKINQQGPILSDYELGLIVDKLDQLVERDSVLAICGSMTPGLDRGFYRDIVRRYRSAGAFVALDADGEAFRLGVQAKPDLVKPNRQELAMWAGRDLTDRTEWYRAIHHLVTQTEGMCLATDGPNQAVLASLIGAWSATPLPAFGSPVGAGDCSLAGLLNSIISEKADGFDGAAALRAALACGTASASNQDTKGLSRESVDRVLGAMSMPLAINLG